MQRTTNSLITGAVAIAVIAAVGVAGAGAVSSVNDDDASDVPITGAALDAATAAALAHTGGGQVTETEVGDEEGFYEVEVTLDDGSQVDVHLTEDFEVIGSEADGPDDDDTTE